MVFLCCNPKSVLETWFWKSKILGLKFVISLRTIANQKRIISHIEGSHYCLLNFSKVTPEAFENL